MTKNYAAILTGNPKPVIGEIMFIAFICLLLQGKAWAQFNYSFSASQETYQPLSSATSLNGNTIWYDEGYKIPLGFSFDMNGIKMDSVNIAQGNLICDEADNFPITGFIVFAATLQDRGNLGDTASMSPVRYQVDGTPGNRIAKIEVWNAGFEDEETLYGTQDDSVNFQVWVYEATGVLEFRYGASRITNASDYFILGVIAGYINAMEMDGSSKGIYFLSGDPAAPILDSVQNIATIANALNSFPSEGTVYKFSPLPTAVSNIQRELTGISVYPTMCTGKLNVNSDYKAVSYKLMSVEGKIVAEGNIKERLNEIDMSQVSTGVYFMHLYNADGVKTVRINRI